MGTTARLLLGLALFAGVLFFVLFGGGPDAADGDEGPPPTVEDPGAGAALAGAAGEGAADTADIERAEEAPAAEAAAAVKISDSQTHGAVRVVVRRHDAEGEIGFRQAMQRLRRVCRCLILFDDHTEPIDRRGILLPVQIVAADLHLLARQMIVGQIDLQSGIA